VRRHRAAADLPASRRTLIDELRQRTKRRLLYCPTCGQGTKNNLRESATRIGMAHTTLWRFVKGGQPSARVMLKIAEWLGIEWSDHA